MSTEEGKSIEVSADSWHRSSSMYTTNYDRLVLTWSQNKVYGWVGYTRALESLDVEWNGPNASYLEFGNPFGTMT